MIRYRLTCQHSHEFEGWFQSSDAFDGEAAARRISCPSCGSIDVSKAIMAPSIAGRENASSSRMAEARALMQRLRSEVETNGEYVGPRFAEEARRIHLEETEPRCVWGEASAPEVRSLVEDGIPVLPLPPKTSS
jgi:hypothetical protein